jgi:hypothetical protein
VTVELLEAEFAKFGALLPGGVSIHVPKFGGLKTAYIKYTDVAGMDAALRAEVRLGGT